jgi:predicted fused transcriptional regulator/phosphomethylpyrimidine kinase
MEVDVLSIERNDKASGPREAAYDVKTTIDGRDRTFEVLVATGKIGPDPISYAVFRDPSEMRLFKHDQRPITDILRGVLDVCNREQALLLPT